MTLCGFYLFFFGLFVSLLDIYLIAFACYMLGNTYEPKSMASFPCYETWNSMPSLTDLVLYMYFKPVHKSSFCVFPCSGRFWAWCGWQRHNTWTKTMRKQGFAQNPLETSPGTSHSACRKVLCFETSLFHTSCPYWLTHHPEVPTQPSYKDSSVKKTWEYKLLLKTNFVLHFPLFSFALGLEASGCNLWQTKEMEVIRFNYHTTGIYTCTPHCNWQSRQWSLFKDYVCFKTILIIILGKLWSSWLGIKNYY